MNTPAQIFSKFNLFILIGGLLLYNIMLVLPYIDMNQPWVYMCPPSWTPPSTSLPIPFLWVIPVHQPWAPSHASNLDWWSVSHMEIYMFQCHSLKSSHPRLLPESPKVCSLYLCLFCCLARRVVTIFLNSIYVLIYCIGVFISDLLHSV